MSRVSPAYAYIASVLLDKGFSLLTIPLAAAYLAPGAFGALDVAVSLIEFAGLVLAFGLGETLMRYAATSATPQERARSSAELMGTALILGVLAGGLLQLLAPTLVAALSIEVDIAAVRLGLLGASVTAFVEMPLVWLRLEQRAGAYMVFVAVRASIQVLAMWLVFALGFGAEGVLVSNALVVIAVAVVLSGQQIRRNGIVISQRGLSRAVLYGIPLVVAGLATFAVGSLSRWFMAAYIDTAQIAHFALAMKLALATALLLQPFSLWWNARRIAVLAEPDGLARSATAWGWGFALLVVSALCVSLVGPTFIYLVFPSAYQPAAMLVPVAVLVCVLNELCTLCNVGSYARTSTFGVMGVNLAGAAIAITAYALLIPSHGPIGAILAMLLGHTTRLVLFLADGHQSAPVPYPAVSAVVLAVTAIIMVVVAPAGGAIIDRLAWTVLSVAVALALAVVLRLISIPPAVLRAINSRLHHAAVT